MRTRDTTDTPPARPGGAGEATACFSLVVSLPSYRLSPNGTRNRFERGRLAKAARDEAANACLVIPSHSRPLWPRGMVAVRAVIVLAKGQRRLDDDNTKALFKATLDGTQGLVVANDRQLVWEDVEWHRNMLAPGGIVRLEFREVRG